MSDLIKCRCGLMLWGCAGSPVLYEEDGETLHICKYYTQKMADDYYGKSKDKKSEESK